MPRYYCDYCDTYLTHDSPSVRKQHNAGYKHKANVRTYYQQFEEQQTQSLIDQRIKEHLGQAAAFQHQVGATFHQHLAALPSQRPRFPILPIPILPVPGIRPPVLPPPLPGTPGYGAVPPMPQVGMPPVLSSVPPQISGVPRPPINLPTTPGAAAVASNNPAAMVNPAMYQIGTMPTSVGINTNLSVPGQQSLAAGGPTSAAVAATLQDGFSYSQTSESSQ